MIKESHLPPVHFQLRHGKPGRIIASKDHDFLSIGVVEWNVNWDVVGLFGFHVMYFVRPARFADAAMMVYGCKAGIEAARKRPLK